MDGFQDLIDGFQDLKYGIQDLMSGIEYMVYLATHTSVINEHLDAQLCALDADTVEITIQWFRSINSWHI